MPVNAAGNPKFAGIGSDGALWGPLVEKVFAKLNGNYENIGYGFPAEAYNFLTNVPVSSYYLNKLSADSFF